MAMPNLLFGPDGEQYNQYDGTRVTNQRWPLGTQLICQDGRKYRFSLAGGSALVVGNVLATAANQANHVDTTAVATAAGSRTLTTTLGATAATANQYSEGYAMVSVTPGAGETYVIATHPAAGSSETLEVTLASGQQVRTALTTTSRVDLIKHPYDGVIQFPASISGHPVGVACTAIAAGDFGWVQTRGMAAVLTAGTVVIGAGVVGDTATAGAAGPVAAATEPIIGYVRRVAASTAWSPIFLLIDG
jgi:hypothetical protein